MQQTFDLVLMDCEMPILDGFGATHEMRQQGIKTPIVAMTANATVGYRECCLQKDMDDYLSKPVRLATLKQYLTKWSSQSRSQEESGAS